MVLLLVPVTSPLVALPPKPPAPPAEVELPPVRLATWSPLRKVLPPLLPPKRRTAPRAEADSILVGVHFGLPEQGTWMVRCRVGS